MDLLFKKLGHWLYNYDIVNRVVVVERNIPFEALCHEAQTMASQCDSQMKSKSNMTWKYDLDTDSFRLDVCLHPSNLNPSF